MSVMQYSGNVEDPESFSQRDMERLVREYNHMIDAITYVLNYTDFSNKPSFEKTLMARGIDGLNHVDRFMYNRLISAVAMANDLHKQSDLGAYAAFSSLSSIKIRNEISEYENFYADLKMRIGKLQWAFLSEMIFAYDKLCNEIKKYKSKYNNVTGIHNLFANLEKNLNQTAGLIGNPEIKFFTGSLTMQQMIAIKDKLSANQTPISPIHMYHDIVQFEAIKDKILTKKREYSRESHYKNTMRELNAAFDQNVDLIQTNKELTKANIKLKSENAKLSSENARLIAENKKMAQQIANIQGNFIGKIMLNWMQRNK